MLFRLIGFILLLTVSYTLLVFGAPDFADTYGNRELNEKIRNIKEASLKLGTDGNSPTSIFDQLSNKTEEFASGTRQLVNETQEKVNQIQTTVSEKATQVQQAADSVSKAYDALNTAKDDIQRLTDFSGTTQSR